MSKFDILIGAQIRRLFVCDDGQDALAFDTDRGTFAFQTDADCCSETWFADVLGLAALIGAKVQRVEEYAMPDDPKDGRTRQEEDDVMGVKLTTYKGVCTIEYRNSSNGYYGGSIDHVFVAYPLNGGWTEITDDWHA